MRNDTLRGLFIRLWSLLDAAQRRRFLRLQVLSSAMALSTLLGLTAVLPFLAVCADPGLIARNAWLTRLHLAGGFTSPQTFIAFLGGAFVLSVCLGNAINLFGTAAIRRFAHDTGARWQEALFDEYLHRDSLFHALSDGAVLSSRVARHVDGCALGLLQGFLLLITGLVTCALLMLSVLWFNPVAALLATAAFGGAYSAIYFAVRRRLLRNGRTQSERWNGRARLMAGSFGAIKEILLLGNQDFFRRLFARESRAIAHTAADTLTLAQSPRNVIECVAAAALVAAALWLGRAGETRWLTELTFFALAAYRLMPALQQCFGAVAHIGAERAVFEAVESDLRAALLPRSTPPAVNRAAWRGRPHQEIALAHLHFRYAPHLPLVIRDLSLTIPAGARVALVGANGSGKSTLADIIVGLLHPESGEIRIDGEKLDSVNLRAWQSCVAYVPQTVYLRNASVAENIAFGLARADVDETRLRAVARQAQLEDFIATLPRGYDEPLGEHGVRVSGGQRQLIGIARALYHDAALLVLDEATNALDAHNERCLIAALRADPAPRTTLVIAHHVAALRECDRVFELEHGALAGAAGALWLTGLG